MRILTVGWSSYTIWRTMDIQHRFTHLVSGQDSACQFDLFTGYFSSRLALQVCVDGVESVGQFLTPRLPTQVPDLILSCLGLLATGYLGWHLIKVFSEHTFNCVGPPAEVIRMYRVR